MNRSPATSIPAYQKLANSLRASLVRGEFADGRRLPTELELAAAHDVSRQTVRRAMQDLVAEGAIFRIAGKGTFATAARTTSPNHQPYLRQLGSVSDLLNLSIDTELEVIDPLTRRVDVDLAGRLRLAADSLYTMSFRRLHRGDPICITTVHLPPPIADLLTEVDGVHTRGFRTAETVIGLIEARLPGVIATAEQSITVAGLPQQSAHLIERDPDDPMLRMDRLYFDHRHQPVELAVTYYDPRKYTYRTQLSRHSATVHPS